MSTVVDSDAWTGLAPYDVLTDRERTEDQRFGASQKLLFGGIGASLLFCGMGAMLIMAEFQGYKSSAAAMNWPLAKAAVGILLIGAGLAIIPGWWQRWLARQSVVPLIVTNSELRFGTPSQTVRLSTITKMTFRGFPETPSELARVLSPRVGGSPNRGLQPLGPLRLSVQGRAEPFRLDLTMLKGDSSRIGLIICDRLQKLQSRTGAANV